MKTLVISDSGHRFILSLDETADLPELPVQEKPAHQRFMAWWRAECGKMGIEYSWKTAEPQGHRIVQSLLKKHTLEDLQELARHFLLDQGDKLRTNPQHFVLFASQIGNMKHELKRE